MSISIGYRNSAPAIYAGRPVETEPCNPDKDSININPRHMSNQVANVVPYLASILAHEWCHTAQPLGLTEAEEEKPLSLIHI